MPSHARLRRSLERYDLALSTHAERTPTRSRALASLDDWYRTTLPALVLERSRSSTARTAWLELEDLVQLMRWKLARGKWRPRLESLVASNPAASVKRLTSLPAPLVDPASSDRSRPSSSLSSSSTSTVERRKVLDQLCELRGVGPATASAILSVWDPTLEPFMSDPALDYVADYASDDDDDNDDGNSARRGKAKKREYTARAWETFRDEMNERRKREGWESCQELERALYAYGIERTYGIPDHDGGDDIGSKKDETAPAGPAGSTTVVGRRDRSRKRTSEQGAGDAGDGRKETKAVAKKRRT
ncbi:hypothetical protein JCM10212_004558 [Sporobolomyces blumeae]